MTIQQTLKAARYNKTKLTQKLGLTVEMRIKQLQFCIEHEHQTLEIQKAVIQSNKILVILRHCHSSYQIQQYLEQCFIQSSIYEYQKGYSEFMFQSCFLYNKKSLCYIQKPKTVQEKKQAIKVLEELNKKLKPVLQAEQELITSIRQIGLQNKPSVKP